VIKAVMQDSGPLGRLSHANYTRNREVRAWLASLLDADVAVFLPEIADFEIRRNLIVENLTGSLANLDALPSLITYVPITTADMRQAATLWAQSRRSGRTVGDAKELNADVILAAQALRLGCTIATDNVGHLAQFTDARAWQSIKP
jgi:predicted nucleic acid-binding protein